MGSRFLPVETAARPPGLLGPMNPPIDGWAGRRVWIVGASSGIGAELARALARRGARIAVSARRADALREMLADAGGALPADVLLGQARAAETRIDERPSHHDHEGDHDQDEFDSLVVDLPREQRTPEQSAKLAAHFRTLAPALQPRPTLLA